jgi:hypothetical protein
MKFTKLFAVAAIALASLSQAAAQAPSRPIANQSTTVPRTAMVFGATGSEATDITEATGLPIRVRDGVIVPTNSGSAVNAVLAQGDATGFRGLSFSIGGTFVATVQFQVSLDNVNWSTAFAQRAADTTFLSAVTSGGVFYLPTQAPYYRIYLSSWTSGTVTSVAELRQVNLDPATTTALASGSNVIGNVIRASIINEQVNTTLAASATYNGATRDNGTGFATTPWTYFSCMTRSVEGGGTMNQQFSTDGATWITEYTVPLTSGLTTYTTSGRNFTRYHRCQVVNNTTASTGFYLFSQLGE